MPATALSSFVTLISGKPRFSGLSRSDLVLWRIPDIAIGHRRRAVLLRGAGRLFDREGTRAHFPMPEFSRM